MRDVIDQFDAIDDEGTTYRVLVWVKRIDTSSLERGRSWTHSSLREARLEDGRHVNRIDDETFEIVETNTRIRRIR